MTTNNTAGATSAAASSAAAPARLPSLLLALLLTLFVVAACGGDQAGVQPDSKSPGDLPAQDDAPQYVAPDQVAPKQDGQPVSGFVAKVKVKGRETFSIKPMDDGAKLVDADEQELARYTVRVGLRVKVTDPDDRVLGQVKGDRAKLHVEGPDGARTFALQRQEDGDYKLETAAGALRNKIKARDYGWKVEDAAGNELFKVKTKAGKTSLRDASDATLLSTKASIDPLAMACLGLDALDQAMRVALAVRVQAEAR